MSTIQDQSEELPRITNATPSEADSPSCTNCESRSHTLLGCLHAPNGTIFGCPFCKNGTHLMEECSNFAAASLVDVVRVLIWDRSAMPAWQTKVHWHHYLAELMSSTQSLPVIDYVRRWTVLQRPFPWGENFAQRFSQSDDFTLFQMELDGGCSDNLPIDPTTAGIVATCGTYDIPFLVSWYDGDPADREFPGPASRGPVAREFPGPASRDPVAREFPGPASRDPVDRAFLRLISRIPVVREFHGPGSSSIRSRIETLASLEFDTEDPEVDANDLDVDIGIPPVTGFQGFDFDLDMDRSD